MIVASGSADCPYDCAQFEVILSAGETGALWDGSAQNQFCDAPISLTFGCGGDGEFTLGGTAGPCTLNVLYVISSSCSPLRVEFMVEFIGVGCCNDGKPHGAGRHDRGDGNKRRENMKNPKCECECAGFCPRHQMDKTAREVELCQGIANTPDGGLKYWQAWERGELGATAPPNPDFSPRPFAEAQRVRKAQAKESRPCCGGVKAAVRTVGARIRSFAEAVTKFVQDGAQTTPRPEAEFRKSLCQQCPANSGRFCRECGCLLPAKIAMRTEACPVKKWLPAIHIPRPLEDPVRNLMMHIMPIAGNDVWRWNISQIAKRQDLFNGKRVVAIATMRKGRKIHERPKRHLQTEEAEAVIEEFAKHGMRIDEFLMFENDSKRREGLSFVPMMELLQSGSSQEVTFSCHAKGVTHDMRSIVVEWANAMYHVCLDDWPTIENALETYSMAGAFRRFGQFNLPETMPGTIREHFTGFGTTMFQPSLAACRPPIFWNGSLAGAVVRSRGVRLHFCRRRGGSLPASPLGTTVSRRTGGLGSEQARCATIGTTGRCSSNGGNGNRRRDRCHQ